MLKSRECTNYGFLETVHITMFRWYKSCWQLIKVFGLLVLMRRCPRTHEGFAQTTCSPLLLTPQTTCSPLLLTSQRGHH